MRSQFLVMMCVTFTLPWIVMFLACGMNNTPPPPPPNNCDNICQITNASAAASETNYWHWAGGINPSSYDIALFTDGTAHVRCNYPNQYNCTFDTTFTKLSANAIQINEPKITSLCDYPITSMSNINGGVTTASFSADAGPSPGHFAFSLTTGMI